MDETTVNKNDSVVVTDNTITVHYNKIDSDKERLELYNIGAEMMEKAKALLSAVDGDDVELFNKLKEAFSNYFQEKPGAILYLSDGNNNISFTADKWKQNVSIIFSKNDFLNECMFDDTITEAPKPAPSENS